MKVYLGIALLTGGYLGATNYSWVGTGPTPDLTSSSSWTPAGGPPGAADTGMFMTGFSTTPAFNGISASVNPFTPGTFQFNDTTVFTFTINEGAVLDFQNGGITNLGGSVQIFNFPVMGAVANQLNFNNSSTASNSQFNFSATNATTQTLNFNNSSTAGNSQINMQNLGTAFPNGSILFNNSSTAAQSTIDVQDSLLQFSSTSQAGSAQINSSSPGAPSGPISEIVFNNNSSAGSSTLALNKSSLTFNNSASGGSANVSLTNSSSLTINQNNTVGALTTDSSSTVELNNFELQIGSLNLSTTVAGVISDTGSGSLIKVGTGTLTLTGANTYAGGTTINGGTLQVNTMSLPGNVVDNATLQFNQTFDGTFNGLISGTGQLVKIGSGTLTLGGANTYMGGTIINAGNLQVNTTTLPGNVVDNAILTFNQTFDGTFPGNISGTGELVKIGSGTLTLTGSNSYSGGTFLDAGTLQVNTNSLPGNIVDNTTLIFNQTFDGTFGGIISGPGQVIKIGSGTLSLTGGNTYAGGTVINAGNLQVNTNTLPGNVVDNATLTFDQNFDGTFNGLISGTGQLVKIGSGTLTLGAANTYAGGTVINAGNLQVNTSTLPGNVVDNATLTFNQTFDGTFPGNISGTGELVKIGSGTLTLGGANTYSGGTIINGGNLQVNTTTLPGNVVDNAILTFNQTFDGTFGGNISGTGELVKIGSGTLTLTGTNTYTGGTFLEVGTLQVTTSSLPGNIVDDTTLIFNQNFNGTFSGNISGPGELIKTGTGTVTLTGTNTYTGGTLIEEGALAGTTASLRGSIVDDSILIFDQQTKGIFEGSITGTGEVIKEGPGTLVFRNGAAAYTGDTIIQEGILKNRGKTPLGNIIDNAKLIFFNAKSKTYAGDISGTGKVTKAGGGTLKLTGNNSYTGGTLIKKGSLLGNTNSITGNITDNATLIFDQTFNAKFPGNIKGSGRLIKTGKATLTLTGHNTYTGGTIVRQGVLKGNIPGGSILNNGKILGEVIVTGKLGGSGTTNFLTIKKGGAIAPGNSIGTLRVIKNYTQEKGSRYELEIGRKSDQIDVRGKSHLKGGVVEVLPLEEYSINKPYTILKSKKGITGKFEKAEFNHPHLTPVLSYGKNHVHLTLQSHYKEGAKDSNEAHVGGQLDHGHHEFHGKLSELTGKQYTNLFYIAQHSSQRFIQRIYYPLARRIGDGCEYVCPDTTKIWADGEWGKSHLRKGYKLHNWNFTLGAHRYIGTHGTIGVAGSYEQDHIDFGHAHNIMGAIYGAYNPDPVYFISNLLAGYSHDKVRRSIHDRKATGYPKITEVTFYNELGGNIFLGCTTLQPFAGLEYQHFHRNSFKEHGAKRWDLHVEERNVNPVNSRLGLHFATKAWSSLTFGIDAAWLHRFYFHQDEIRAKFKHFGKQFTIEGVELHHDAFQGSLNFTAALPKNIDLFAEVAGDFWKHFYAYTFTGGLSWKW